MLVSLSCFWKGTQHFLGKLNVTEGTPGHGDRSFAPRLWQPALITWRMPGQSRATVDLSPPPPPRDSLIAQSVEASACNARDPGLIPGSGSSPGEGNGNPTPEFLPGESRGWSSLADCGPYRAAESDKTER